MQSGLAAYTQSLDRQQLNRRMSEKNIKAILTQRATDASQKGSSSIRGVNNNLIKSGLFSPDGIKNQTNVGYSSSPVSEYNYVDNLSVTRMSTQYGDGITSAGGIYPTTEHIKKIKSFTVDHLGVLNIDEEYFSAPNTYRAGTNIGGDQPRSQTGSIASTSRAVGNANVPKTAMVTNDLRIVFLLD